MMQDMYAVTVLAVVSVLRFVRADDASSAAERVLAETLEGAGIVRSNTDVEFIVAHDVQRTQDKIEYTAVDDAVGKLRPALNAQPDAWLVEMLLEDGSWGYSTLRENKPTYALPNNVRAIPLYRNIVQVQS